MGPIPTLRWAGVIWGELPVRMSSTPVRQTRELNRLWRFSEVRRETSGLARERGTSSWRVPGYRSGRRIDRLEAHDVQGKVSARKPFRSPGPERQSSTCCCAVPDAFPTVARSELPRILPAAGNSSEVSRKSTASELDPAIVSSSNARRETTLPSSSTCA